MEYKNGSILKSMKKEVAIIIAMTISVIICLTVLMYQSGKRIYEEGALVNTLGKQRILIQVIVKDVTRIYALLQALQTDDNVDPVEMIITKISSSKDEIKNSAEEFEKTLTGIHNGYINSTGIKVYFDISGGNIREDVEKVNTIWESYRKSIDIVMNEARIGSSMANAVIYINENSDELLKYSDGITQKIVDNKKNNAFYYMIFSAILIIIFIIAMVTLFIRMFKYLIIPLDALYKGITGISMVVSPVKLSMPTKKELVPIISEINYTFEKNDRLFSLIENISKNSSFSEVLDFIFKSFSSFIPYTYIGIALIKEDGKMLEATYGISDGSVVNLPNRLMGKRYLIEGTSLGKILDTGNARIINDLEEYSEGRKVNEYTRIILEAGITSSITLPLSANGRHVGIIFFSNTHKNCYTEEHVKFLQTLANSIAISFEKNIFLDNLLYSTVLALAKLAEKRDEDTGEHLDRMKVYSRSIAKMLQAESEYKDEITMEYLDDIERFSPLHDVGKVAIKDDILLKPAKLTKEEFEEMKRHTVFGAEVLISAENNIKKSGKSLFKVGIEIAEGHHEKWDGSGYPYGKCGLDIPLSARIVAVADVFDALTTKRPYKEAFPFEASFNHIIDGAGKHFDPEIVRVFARNKQTIFELYKSFRYYSNSHRVLDNTGVG